jgi:predicted O-methyltransferase YrrM
MQEHLQSLLNRTLSEDRGNDANIEHAFTFFSIALQIKAKNVLELGVRHGGSTYPLLVACKALDGHLTSVDIDDPQCSFSDDLTKYWTFVKSDALEFLEKNEQKYDLVYVDDWHSYKHVKKELEFIDKFADKNTIILLHDLMGMSHHPNYFNPIDHGENSEWGEGGPFRAVSELDSSKWEWATIPVGHGLTILRKKI